MNNITSIRSHPTAGYGFLGAITLDGRVIFSGRANSINKVFGLYGSDAGVAIYTGMSIDFPEPIVDVALLSAKSGTTYVAATVVKTASGKLFGSGRSTLFTTAFIQGSYNFMQLTLPE